MNQFTLFNYFRSSASYRVRIAMNIKGLPFEYRAIHLIKDGGEQHSPEYRRLNPMGEVPCLVHKSDKGERVLAQSMAIIQYLDDQFPQTPLFSKDSYKTAQIIQLCENINASIQPLQNLKILKYLETEFHLEEKRRFEWAAHWIRQGLTGFQKIVESHGGKYCCGNEITAADVFFAPQVFASERFGVSIAEFPTLEKVYSQLKDQDAFFKAHPLRQIDCPPELKIK